MWLHFAFLFVAILFSLSIVYTCLKLFNVGIFYSQNMPFEIMAVVVCFVGILVCVSAMTIRYDVKNGKLRLMFGFFDVLGGRCQLKTILNVLIKTNGKLYLSYMVKDGADPLIIQVAIESKDYDRFCDILTKENEDIVVQQEYEENSDSK